MEELVKQLVEKVGIDQATAEKVVSFLKQHASEVPGWLSNGAAQDMLKKATGGLGDILGGKKS